MMLPRWVSEYRDRHGQRRLVFRRVGYPRHTFRSEPGTSAFDKEYAGCVDGSTQERRQHYQRTGQTIPAKGREIVYFVGADGDGPVKIGMTADMRQRLIMIQDSNAEPMRLLAWLDGSREVEREYHRRFGAWRMMGEWFERCPEILDEIARLESDQSLTIGPRLDTEATETG